MNNVVGPGRYNFKSYFEQTTIPGVSGAFPKERCFRGRNDISPIRKSIEANPGPGTYSPKLFEVSSQSAFQMKKPDK